MRLGNTLLAAIVLLLSAPVLTRASPTSGGSGTKPLNVVLILADDLGWADLGCYGSTFHRTPHLDELAARGMRFTNAYAAASICSPTRASILVGKAPARLHLTDWLPGRADMRSQRLARPPIITHLPPEEVTLAEALRPAGYASASIGKWHLGGRGFLPERHGFDLNVAGTAGGSPASWVSPYRIPTLPDGPPGERLTARLTDETLSFIESHKDRPFFLYLPHFAVHIPLNSREERIEKYHRCVREGDKQTNPVYAALLEELDESVGRVMGSWGSWTS
jgi:arylsulfatase A-like enzyme